MKKVKKMLYKISQEASDYDTYSGAVVCAESEKEAVKIDPSGFRLWHDGAWWFQCADHEEKEKTGGDQIKVGSCSWSPGGVKDIHTHMGAIVVGIAGSSAVENCKHEDHGLMSPVCRPVKNITQQHLKGDHKDSQKGHSNHQFPDKDIRFVHSHHKFIQTSHTLLLR